MTPTRKKEKREITPRERIFSVVRIAAASYVGLAVLLFVLQDRLLFHPVRLTSADMARIREEHPRAREEHVTVGENLTVRGWFVRRSTEKKQPLVIYFGGNGEEVSHFAGDVDRFWGWSLAFFNYRGYGLSDGKPGEKALCHDALAIYDEFAARPEIDPQRIVVMGRSLGSGVAVYVARQRPVAGVILITPYDSVPRVAQRGVPFMPVSLLMRNRFDSISRAPSISAPMLAITAERDRTIPPVHGERLAASWKGEVTLVKIPGADHHSLDEKDLYWKSITDFLAAR